MQGEARYANSLDVGFNAAEFILEFTQSYPDEPPVVVVRIVTSPLNARAFLATLSDAIQKFEESFGPLTEE